MSSPNYFSALIADQRVLAAHGLDHWPNIQELTLFAFSQAEKIDALYAACGMIAVQDARGKWIACPSPKGVA